MSSTNGLPKFVMTFKDRHGTPRFYVRRHGRTRTLPPPSHPGFMAAYDDALRDLGNEMGASTAHYPENPGLKRVLPGGKRVRVAPLLDRLLRAALMRAKKQSIPFDLCLPDLEQIFIAQRGRCAVTGLPFELGDPTKKTTFRRPLRMSLDRIAGQKGYVRGNVRLVCVAANYAMNEWGERTFLIIAAAAVSYAPHRPQQAEIL